MLLPLRNPETILLWVIAMTVVPYVHSAAESVLNQQYLTNLVFLTILSLQRLANQFILLTGW